jgi:hypothetical protein
MKISAMDSSKRERLRKTWTSVGIPSSTMSEIRTTYLPEQYVRVTYTGMERRRVEARYCTQLNVGVGSIPRLQDAGSQSSSLSLLPPPAVVGTTYCSEYLYIPSQILPRRSAVLVSFLHPSFCPSSSVGSLDIAVVVTTGYGLDDRGVGVRVPVGSRIFSSPSRPDRLWGPPCLLSNGYWGFPRG